MKVLLIGATRGIGRELLDQALDARFQVTVLARNPAAVTRQASNLTMLKGDVLEPRLVNSAIQGQDAVCLTIGVPITFSPVTVFSRGTLNVLAAMEEHQVRRLICVTGIGAGDSKGHGGFLYDRLFKPLLLGPIYADKDRQEEYVRESSLDWTIVRPAGLTNGPRTGRYRVVTDLSGVTAGRISRADVADFIVGELNTPRHICQTPLLSY